MKFVYEAFDATGKGVRGTTESAGVNEATESLRRQGLYVTTIAESRGAIADAAAHSHAHSGKRIRMGKGRLLKNLALFTRQLAVLVASGTPLVDAMGALERQSADKAWRELVASLRMRVEEGTPLSEAMAGYPEIFDAVARSLVAAGEAGGIFDTMLDRLAVLTKKSLHLRQAIVGAMVYPALLIVIAINVLCCMLLFVLPKFTELFQSMDAPIPSSTLVLVHLSDLMRNYWWAGLIGIGVTFAAGRYWLATPTGRRVLDTIVVRAPGLGKMTRSFNVARIARVLGTLLNGRVPMLDALALARQTCRNSYFIDLVSRAEEAVTRGMPVSAAFGESDLVMPAVVEAIRSGEQSGQVATLMLNMADFLDEENDVVVKSLTSILEPVILIALGVVVGFIAISMFLPMFDLTSMAQGGH